MAATLVRLSEMLRQRNLIDEQISSLIGRPATAGHITEFIASNIFGITLNESASAKDLDGYFQAGVLKGCSVNVKFQSKNDGLLNISPNAICNYYLVLTGPKTLPASSRGKRSPFLIEAVFLFDAHALVDELQRHQVKIGIATSVRKQLWEKAEIYPAANNNLLVLTAAQRDYLALFK